MPCLFWLDLIGHDKHVQGVPHAIMSCMYVSCMYRFIYYLAWDMDVWFVSEVFSVTLSLIEGWCCCGWSGQKTWEHVAARLHMVHLVKHGRLCLCCASCFAGITDVVFFILQMAGAVLVVVMPHGQRSLHRCWCKKQVLPKAGGLCHHSPHFQIGHLGKRRNMWVRSVKDLELWKAMGNTRCIHPHLFERTVAVALCSMWMRQGLWRVALVWAPWCPTWGRCNCIGMLLPLRSSAKSKLSDNVKSSEFRLCLVNTCPICILFVSYLYLFVTLAILSCTSSDLDDKASYACFCMYSHVGTLNMVS